MVIEWLRRRAAPQRVSVAVVLAAVIAGCSGPAVPEPAFGLRVQETCLPRGSEDYFFLPGTITANTIVHNRLRDDYAHLLSESGQTPMWCGGERPEAYRLIWLPVRVAPLVVSVEEGPQGWIISGAEYRTLPMQSPDPRAAVRIRVSRQVARLLDAQSVQELRRALDAAHLWTAPAFAGGGEDGYVWTIEGRRQGRYRVVTRWNADDDAFEEAGRALVRLSGLNVPPEIGPD
jgi:hypothetical protein